MGFLSPMGIRLKSIVIINHQVMVTLSFPRNPDKNFISIVKKGDEDLWNIYAGYWYQAGRETADLNLKATEEVLMSANDLMRMAFEIRRCLAIKNIEAERLNLTFYDNKPDMIVGMYYLTEGARFYHPSEEGLFAFGVTINVFYSTVKHTREEDQYLYENGGDQTGLTKNYPPELLAKFADDLEAEALPYLTEEEIAKLKEQKSGIEATGFSNFLRFFKKK